MLHFLKSLRLLVGAHGLSMYTILMFAVFLDKIVGERFYDMVAWFWGKIPLMGSL